MPVRRWMRSSKRKEYTSRDSLVCAVSGAEPGVASAVALRNVYCAVFCGPTVPSPSQDWFRLYLSVYISVLSLDQDWTARKNPNQQRRVRALIEPVPSPSTCHLAPFPSPVRIHVPRPVSPCPVLSCPVLSCPVLSCPVPSHPIPSHPIPSHPIPIPSPGEERYRRQSRAVGRPALAAIMHGIGRPVCRQTDGRTGGPSSRRQPRLGPYLGLGMAEMRAEQKASRGRHATGWSRCMLSDVRCSLSIVGCLLSTVYCLLSALRCSLSVVCCFVVRCPLFSVRCPLPTSWPGSRRGMHCLPPAPAALCWPVGVC